MSVRDAVALQQGADEDMLAKVDRYQASDLPDHQKAALRLADVYLAAPGGMTAELEEELKLEEALAKLETKRRIAVLHYSPMRGTLVGEPRHNLRRRQIRKASLMAYLHNALSLRLGALVRVLRVSRIGASVGSRLTNIRPSKVRIDTPSLPSVLNASNFRDSMSSSAASASARSLRRNSSICFRNCSFWRTNSRIKRISSVRSRESRSGIKHYRQIVFAMPELLNPVADALPPCC